MFFFGEADMHKMRIRGFHPQESNIYLDNCVLVIC